MEKTCEVVAFELGKIFFCWWLRAIWGRKYILPIFITLTMGRFLCAKTYNSVLGSIWWEPFTHNVRFWEERLRGFQYDFLIESLVWIFVSFGIFDGSHWNSKKALFKSIFIPEVLVAKTYKVFKRCNYKA